MQSRVATQIASAVFRLNRDSRSTPSKISSPMALFVALRHLEFVHLYARSSLVLSFSECNLRRVRFAPCCSVRSIGYFGSFESPSSIVGPATLKGARNPPVRQKGDERGATICHDVCHRRQRRDICQGKNERIC